MIKEKVFYEDNLFEVGKYSVRIGYVPETKVFIAVRDKDPFFCFSADTLDEAKEKAKRALLFYQKHGLEERDLEE